MSKNSKSTETDDDYLTRLENRNIDHSDVWGEGWEGARAAVTRKERRRVKRILDDYVKKNSEKE